MEYSPNYWFSLVIEGTMEKRGIAVPAVHVSANPLSNVGRDRPPGRVLNTGAFLQVIVQTADRPTREFGLSIAMPYEVQGVFSHLFYDQTRLNIAITSPWEAHYLEILRNRHFDCSCISDQQHHLLVHGRLFECPNHKFRNLPATERDGNQTWQGPARLSKLASLRH